MTTAIVSLNLGKLFGALVFIGLVLIYAKWQKWGEIKIEDRVLGVPGGALTTSPPLWEFIFFWFTPINTATGVMVANVAAFFLIIRLILNLIGIVAIILRWVGVIDSIICMDNRTWAIAKPDKTNNNHSGLCGAWATMSYIGVTPGMAIVGVLLMIGINVPFWLALIISFPYIFVFGKHLHNSDVQRIGDTLHLSEVPGWGFGSLLAWMKPSWQRCDYSGEKHNHD